MIVFSRFAESDDQTARNGNDFQNFASLKGIDYSTVLFFGKPVLRPNPTILLCAGVWIEAPENLGTVAQGLYNSIAAIGTPLKSAAIGKEKVSDFIPAVVQIVV